MAVPAWLDVYSHPHTFICAESEHVVYFLMSPMLSLRITRQRVQIYSHHYLTQVCWELGKSKPFAEMCIDWVSLTIGNLSIM